MSGVELSGRVYDRLIDAVNRAEREEYALPAEARDIHAMCNRIRAAVAEEYERGRFS